MTYLERITYLVGNFIELSQYALKNAFRVAALNTCLNGLDDYTKGSEMLIQAESMAKKLLEEYEYSGAMGQLNYFSTAGISQKNYTLLCKVIKKRDYVTNLFFVENGYALSKEEIAVYESKIVELQELCSLAKDVIVKLDKECEKLYHSF